MGDIEKTFASLQSIMSNFESHMEVVANEPGYYYLNTLKKDSKDKSIFFGMVKW